MNFNEIFHSSKINIQSLLDTIISAQFKFLKLLEPISISWNFSFITADNSTVCRRHRRFWNDVFRANERLAGFSRRNQSNPALQEALRWCATVSSQSGPHSAKMDVRPIRAFVWSKQIIRLVLIKLLERKHRE